MAGDNRDHNGTSRRLYAEPAGLAKQVPIYRLLPAIPIHRMDQGSSVV